MRAIRFTFKVILFLVMLTLSLAWMIFFGIFATACVASVVFFPVGIACYGLAIMPLFAALGWMGMGRHQNVNVTVSR